MHKSVRLPIAYHVIGHPVQVRRQLTQQWSNQKILSGVGDPENFFSHQQFSHRAAMVIILKTDFKFVPAKLCLIGLIFCVMCMYQVIR